MSTVDQPFSEIIYDEIKKLYGQGTNSLLQMMLPCTLLEKGNYDYPGNDTIDNQQRKPETVVDAEFRLVDDTFDLAKLVAGPRGVKVSQTYSDILYQLVPSSKEEGATSAGLVPDQDFIVAWLTEEVNNWELPANDVLENVPDSLKEDVPAPKASVQNGTTQPPKIPRIDLYQKLLNAYEQERFRWEQFKILSRPDFSNPNKVNDYNKMLAFYQPTVDKKLEALWAMLCVRGQYHRIRRYLGYIDVESGPEILLNAKENLRASVFRSIDDTQDVYPVYLTPGNWAKYLSTAFKPEDLLSSEDMIAKELFDKEKERSDLILQRNSITANAQDIAKLEKEEQAARTNFLNAQDAVMGHMADAAVQVVKLYFKAKNSKTKNPDNVKGDKAELNKALKDKDQKEIDDDKMFNDLVDNYKAGLKAESDMQAASEALARAQLASASARGNDQSTFLAELESKINSLGFDIDYLSKVLQSSKNPTGTAIAVTDDDGNTELVNSQTNVPPTIPKSVQVPPQTEGASVWQEVVIEMHKSSTATSHFDTAHASHMDWSVNLFFGSASGSDSSSTASSKNTRNSTNTDVKIGFRCMKVDIGRPWFNPSLFARTKEFCHMTSSSKIAPATGPLIDAINNNKGMDDPVLIEANKCQLPTYPTAFIVVKDVHIILESTSNFEDSEVSDMQHSFNAGGGLLCFRVSKSESSSEHRTAATIAANGSSASIKIPAPQVLAWISEFVPEDEASGSYVAINRQEFGSLKAAA